MNPYSGKLNEKLETELKQIYGDDIIDKFISVQERGLEFVFETDIEKQFEADSKTALKQLLKTKGKCRDIDIDYKIEKMKLM